MNSKQKGGNFERLTCRQLSLWWSQDQVEPNPDVFWRSQNSGGRATTRTKKAQKNLQGQHGDMTFTDPVGKPLIDLITFELKVGYSKASIHDALDRPTGSKSSIHEEWFKKAQASSEAAGTFAWALIHKRNRREAMIFMPLHAWMTFEDIAGDLPMDFITIGACKIAIVGHRLSDFLDCFKPRHAKELLEKLNHAKGTPLTGGEDAEKDLQQDHR